MDEILEQQVADGQVSARNRRRGKQQEKVVENKETNQLRDSIGQLNNKVKRLNSLLKKLNENHKEIASKQQIMENLE